MKKSVKYDVKYQYDDSASSKMKKFAKQKAHKEVRRKDKAMIAKYL